MKWMSSPSISVMKLRQGVQLRLALAPVVLGRPVASERLHRRELHALRKIFDGLLLGPARGHDARTQVVEIGLGHLDRERADRWPPAAPCSAENVVVSVIFDSLACVFRAAIGVTRQASQGSEPEGPSAGGAGRTKGTVTPHARRTAMSRLDGEGAA